MHVVVIGAGIVGAVTAVELLRDGHEVTILEPGEPGGEQAASYGNGAWFSPSSVLPVTAPGIGGKVPGWLMDPLGPLTIRWSYLPAVLPWLRRFIAAGKDWKRVRRLASAMRPLVADCPQRHQALAEEAGVGHLVSRTGLMYVFPSRADYEAEAESWKIRAEQGVTWLELDENELRQRVPELDRRYACGLLVEEGAHCLDPGAYVAALVALARKRGASVVRGKATGFARIGRRLRGVQTDGEPIACDAAVIAAGAHSRVLARAVGCNVPLETERGYHAAILDPETGPRIPVMPSDGKMVATLTAGTLRIAGQVEIAGLRAAPNWKRAEVLRQVALRTFPGLPRDLPASRVKVWMGHRPSMPDSLPCIGRARDCTDVVLAFGHGHIGLASGALTGRLVADIVSGKKPVVDPAPYSPARFA
jgi:D-amino-acid dehydrogenase